MTAAILALALLLSLAGCGSSDGKTHLTFQIWDVNQRKGMQEMCDAYTANVNSDVVIEVQVTSWDEYWTKLEAAIPAYIGTEESWRHAFDAYSEKLDVDIIFEQFDYGIQSVNNSACPRWKDSVQDELSKAYRGDQSLDAALQNIQNIINTETAKKLAEG